MSRGDQRTYRGAGQDRKKSHFLHHVLDGQLRSRDKILEDKKKKTKTKQQFKNTQSQPSDMNKLEILS